jgi:hypothetical protein
MKSSNLMSGAPLAGCAAAVAPRGGRVQQPPLLLRLIPLPVLLGPGEGRVHGEGIVGGYEVIERPRDRLADAASSAARSDAAAAAASSFFGFLFLPRAGDDEARAPSRMMRALLLCPLVGGGDAGSVFMVILGVAAGGVDPQLHVADLDAVPDEDDDAMRRGSQELPCQRDREGTAAGSSIPMTG